MQANILISTFKLYRKIVEPELILPNTAFIGELVLESAQRRS